MKRFGYTPWVLAIVHVLIVVCTFAPAIYNPASWGLYTNVAFYYDLPFSVAYTLIEEVLTGILGLRGRLILDGVLHLLFGTVWWFFLGVLVIKIWRRVLSKSHGPSPTT